jgi:ABC-type branched-subunit amino acid transport system substrate-binding protein
VGLGLVAVAVAATAVAPSASAAPATKINPALPPLRVGWTNGDTGAGSAFPFITDGARAAADYINVKLGGINGRKLELVTCSASASAESLQKCGQQFANDSSISMGMVGLVQAGASFYSTLNAAGKPVLGAVPVTTADFNAPTNTWFYAGGSAATYFGMADLAKRAKAKKIAFLATDAASGIQGSQVFRDQLKGTGATVKVVPVPNGASDALPQVIASGAQDADFIGVGITDCLATMNAIRLVHPKGIIAGVGSCVSATNVTKFPKVFEGVQFGAYGRVTGEPKGQNADVDQFNTYYPRYARLAANPPGPNAEKGWSIVLTLRNALLNVPQGQMTNKSTLASIIKNYTGPLTMGAKSIKCPGSVKGYPSICNMQNIFYAIKNGQFKQI